MDIISQIQRAMAAQGIGVVELSRRAGKASHRHFSDILRGRQAPGPETLQELADALRVTIEVEPTPARRFEPRVATGHGVS